MTREEEIQHKAGSISDGMIAHNISQSECKGYYEGYIDGANWADNHPKSPWISTKDKLPTRGCLYLCMDDDHNVVFLAFVGDKWFNSRTFADVPLDVVIYWMPIPDLPKE